MDKDYGDDSYGADFDTTGRLVTTCWDSYIRLYSPAGDAGKFKLIAKARAPGGKRPVLASFSPDGQKISVGFDDSTKVDVLSGKDLSHLYSPDTTGVVLGNLVAVAWSSDGKALYAGGRYIKRGLCPIRKWAVGGTDGFMDIPVATNTIMQILPLRSGEMVYTSLDPSFGVIDARDQKVLDVRPVIADYRNLGNRFLLSSDGSTVQFSYENFGKSLMQFSVDDLVLTTRSAKADSLRPPIVEASDLKITGWIGTAPALDRKALPLARNETSTSLAISPDQKSFLLGAAFNIHLFDHNGSELWKVPAPYAWSVNISGNGKLAVAALSDGTIRWYRMTDGKELLAFFPHNEKRRWVLWTPSGYYDASPGGEELIGWHLNQGKDAAADFFPASRFRATAYRPDVVSSVLETLDEGQAVMRANEEAGRRLKEINVAQILPPVVQIISPADATVVSSTEITIRFTVRSPSGEAVTGVKALVDGRPVAAGRGLKVLTNEAEERGLKVGVKDAEVREMLVSIPDQDCEVSLIAENRYAPSVPATVRLKWRGKVVAEEFVVKAKLYLLAVGVSKYANKDVPSLGLPAKDARDFAAVMQNQRGGLYRDVVVKVLTDEAATKEEVLDGLDWIRKQTTSKDVAMVFLAGHGVNDQTGAYYFCPFNTDPEKLLRTGVPFSDIKNAVASIAGKAVFFVDTCHSGNVMGTRRAVVDITGFVNELASAENGAVVFAASTGKQYSLEDPVWGNGAFTKALVEGIDGKADYTGVGKITINMLDLYISERVKELTKGQQTPTTTKPQTVSDFPVAVRR